MTEDNKEVNNGKGVVNPDLTVDNKENRFKPHVRKMFEGEEVSGNIHLPEEQLYTKRGVKGFQKGNPGRTEGKKKKPRNSFNWDDFTKALNKVGREQGTGLYMHIARMSYKDNKVLISVLKKMLPDKTQEMSDGNRDIIINQVGNAQPDKLSAEVLTLELSRRGLIDKDGKIKEKADVRDGNGDAKVGPSGDNSPTPESGSQDTPV